MSDELHPVRHSPRVPVPGRLWPEGWEDEGEIRFIDYWQILLARRWTVLATLATVVALAMLWTFRQVPLFSATSRVQIERENPNILSFEDVYAMDSSTDDTLRTQFEILESRTLAARVIDELPPEEVTQFLLRPGLLDRAGAWLCEFTSVGDRPASCERDPANWTIDEYLGRLTITPVTGARLADISFESEDPAFAARAINTHAQIFIDQNLRFRYDATQVASAFLSENLGMLKIDLEKAEDRLQEYSREHQIIFGQDGQSAEAEKLEQLQAEFTAAQSDRFSKEAYVRLIANGNTGALISVVENPVIAELTAGLSSMRSEEAELSVTLGPEFPDLRRLRNRIAETERLLEEETRKILRTLEAEYQTALERETLLSGAIDEQTLLVNQINQEIVQYDILKREADARRRLYEGLLDRLGEAEVSSTLKASNIRIVDRATVPDQPIKPRKGWNLVLSLVGGLVLGIGAALVQDRLDDSVTSTEQVVQYMGVPTLGVIPKARSKAVGRLTYPGGYGKPRMLAGKIHGPELFQSGADNELEFVSHSAPSSLLAEAYRSVRTSLLLSSPDSPPKSILITSPSPGEGKTVTALNVAISLTQTGAKTLLVNADMRNPRIDSLLKERPTDGLSGVLAGAVSPHEAILDSGIPNLYLLPCGTIPPNPGELLMSERFRELLRELSGQYDHIVFDSPPVNNVSDARILAHFVECTVVVLRAASTSRHLARQVLQQLGDSGSRTAGVILNDWDPRHGAGYTYSHAGYYYPYSES